MSKNSYSKVGGENVSLLQALIDEAPSYTKPTNSRNANILKSIINNTEYTEPPQSEIEELLIELKARIGGEIEVNELEVTENGTYDAGLNKAFNPVKVNVPEAVLKTKSITANGTYQASSDNADGYSQVSVNVEGYKISEVSGLPSSIATFTDGSALPMPKLEVAIEPVQEGSGDPSPTNIRPISGWSAVDVTDCGKNILDPNITGTDGYYDDNGEYHTSQITGYYGPIPIDASTQYSTKIYAPKWAEQSGIDATLAVYFFDKNNNWISREKTAIGQTSVSGYTNTLTFTTPATCSKIYLQAIKGNAVSAQLDLSQSVVTLGNVADFEPYNGSTITIQLGDTYYGGKLDVVSGVLTVDREYVDLGTLSWGSASDGRVYSSAIADIKPITASSTVSNIMCSNYATVSARAVYDKTTNGSICIAGAGYGGDKCIGVYDSLLANKSASEVTQAMNGVQLVYELATPTTIQLTPAAVKSLLGTNNLFADTGDVVEASYFESL